MREGLSWRGSGRREGLAPRRRSGLLAALLLA